VTAARYSSLVDGEQARAVLAAAGVDVAALPRQEPAVRRRPLPGPYTVAATRLLFKRLWRLGMFNNLPRRQLLDAAAALRSRADEGAWDEGPFWGWSEQLRAEAIERFRPGNDVFARAVWGEPWGDDWADGDVVDVDLASSQPALVVDVLQSVDALVKEQQTRKAAKLQESQDSEDSEDPGRPLKPG
jgi:hypothetical protein